MTRWNRQEGFQCEYLELQEIRFENEHLEQCNLFEASTMDEEAKFQAEITQRRLQHRKEVDEELQKSLANHIQEVVQNCWEGHASHCPIASCWFAHHLWCDYTCAHTGLPATNASSRGMRTSQNSGGEPSATQQAGESNDSGSVGKQPYTYMHSGSTMDSGFGAFAEALSCLQRLWAMLQTGIAISLQSGVKRKCLDTASGNKDFLMPFKQL